VCEKFLKSFEKHNPEFDIYNITNMERIFAPLLARREKSVYARLKTAAPRDYEIERSRDLRMWSDNLPTFVENVSRYLIADRAEIIVAIFDNVDRLGKDEQIRIFSVAQWFKSLTKAFCVLQMRDETYERFKDEKPLDTYRTAVRFYIRPPRFVDVIKKRVWLAQNYINDNLPKELSYQLPDGKRITYSRDDLERFLLNIYQNIFQKQRNAARIVESLAGRDTRRSLETFTRILTSGHFSEQNITNIATGAHGFSISEGNIIKILMRTSYKLFSDGTGPISNIFITDNDWARPSTLLALEFLNFLIDNRRVNGEIGLQGYFAINTVQNELEASGFDRGDVLKCAELLLQRNLIVSDQLQVKGLQQEHSVKVHASGFIHQRILCERIEYIFGVLPIFPFRSRDRADSGAQYVLKELASSISIKRQVEAAKLVRDQLDDDIEFHCLSYSVYRSDLRGSTLTLERMNKSIDRMMTPSRRTKKVELL
jgi:hypothetical protein